MKRKSLALSVAAAFGCVVVVWAIFNLVNWLLVTPQTQSQPIHTQQVDVNTPSSATTVLPAATESPLPAPNSTVPNGPEAVVLAPPNAAQPSTPSVKDAFSVIFSRKSVRKFQNKPVAKTDLELILKAGMAAPSAVDRRPWAFIVVTERKQLDTMAEKLPHAKMLFQATAAIVVLGDLDKALPGEGQAYWVQDCSAVTQNILLAVEALGLGAVWTAAYPSKEREAAVREVLGLPLNVIPLNVIPIGYPEGDPKPKDKWDPGTIHWEKW